MKKAIREETAEFRQKANIRYLSFSEKGVVGMRLIVSNSQNGNTGGKQAKIMNNVRATENTELRRITVACDHTVKNLHVREYL